MNRVVPVFHAVHHASRPPTAWADGLSPDRGVDAGLCGPLAVFVVPIHVGALGVVLTAMTVMGVTNHMGWEIFPRAMVHGRGALWIITASHHQRHHEI
jgi:sterol desaturase/sphingolipid hydroxylase (fatty acid hydroxylase superfamily)